MEWRGQRQLYEEDGCNVMRVTEHGREGRVDEGGDIRERRELEGRLEDENACEGASSAKEAGRQAC